MHCGGATTVAGRLDVDGAAEVGGALAVLGALTVGGTIDAGTDILTCGPMSTLSNLIYTGYEGGSARQVWSGVSNSLIFSAHSGSAQKTGSLAWAAIASDSRLKTTIAPVPLADAAARINALRLVTYQWSPAYAALQGHDPEYVWTGLISQEYYGVYPTPEAERPHQMLDLGEGAGEQAYYGMDKGISDFELIGAVQHASARADLAEARLADLEARLAAAGIA
jgi:hypothetical protein